MATCRICLEELKKPVSLPCGHIFCSQCIVQTVQAVKPYSNLHPCPICRSLYNIAPLNVNTVPPNLRPFVTPSIRKVFIDVPGAESSADADAKDPSAASAFSASSSSGPSLSSEVTRLRAENHALRNNCAMWRRRAEMHGTANLGLLNFARVIRDQAAQLARERDALQKCVTTLKRRMDGDESTSSEHGVPVTEVSPQTIIGAQDTSEPPPDSLLLSPLSLPDLSSERNHSGPSTRVESSPENFDRPRKRAKYISHTVKTHPITYDSGSTANETAPRPPIVYQAS